MAKIGNGCGNDVRVGRAPHDGDDSRRMERRLSCRWHRFAVLQIRDETDDAIPVSALYHRATM